MKKCMSCLLFAALLLCAFNSPMVYAAGKTRSVSLEEKIRAVVNKYEGYEVVDLKDVEGVVDADQFFKLNSVQELDQLLKSFKKSANKRVRVEVSPNEVSKVTMPSNSAYDIVPYSYTGVQSQTKWAPSLSIRIRRPFDCLEDVHHRISLGL